MSVRKQLHGFLDADDEVRYVFPADVLFSAKPSVLFVVSRKQITILGTAFWLRRRLRSVQAPATPHTAWSRRHAGDADFEVSGMVYEVDDEAVEYALRLRLAPQQTGQVDADG